TSSPEQTEALGRRLGQLLQAGDIVALSGDLGAGKTVLARGIAEGAGAAGYIASPTFTFIRAYRGAVTVYHVDLYRLDRPQQVEAVAVSTGPGSFTSLRIGIATASAWARARGIPAAGVPTLAAVALGTQAAGAVCAMMDVRRGEVAAAVYAGGGAARPIVDEVVGPVERVLRQLPAGPLTFSGDALAGYAEVIAGMRPDAVLAPRAQWYPTAVS